MEFSTHGSGSPSRSRVHIRGFSRGRSRRDDVEAKRVVATLMREMGVEPFDLGSLKVASAIEPGGALWGRAFTPTELLERVGELSGDG